MYNALPDATASALRSRETSSVSKLNISSSRPYLSANSMDAFMLHIMPTTIEPIHLKIM